MSGGVPRWNDDTRAPVVSDPSARGLRRFLRRFFRPPRSRLVALAADCLLRPAPPTLAARFSWPFLVGPALRVLAMMLCRSGQVYRTRIFDLYPLYHGAQAWLHGDNAYALDAVVPASDHAYGQFQMGNGYPLPAVLLTLPLSLLPPQAAGILWVGLLSAGLLLALRLNGWSCWFVLYMPLLDALRLEQYTVLIVILQLVALWAYRERRLWTVAWCCTLIATKPQHGIFFALALLLLARNWRQQLVAGAVVWGGSVLLDPHWVGEWLGRLVQYHAAANQPTYWFALFAVPLLLIGDYIGGAIARQFLIAPVTFPSAYGWGAMPLGVLGDRRSIWLIPASHGWIIVAALAGYTWATVATLIAPVVLLALLRRWEQGRARREVGRRLAADLRAASP